MKANITGIINNYLENIDVKLMIAAYTCCDFNWREMDYIPGYNKFYLIIEGEGWLKIGSEEFYPKPGQLFLMPAGIKQSFSYINEKRFRKYWCHFTASIGDVNLFDIIKVPFGINLDVHDFKSFKNEFQKLLEYKNLSGELTSVFRIKSVLLNIISLYIEKCKHKLELSASLTMEKLNDILVYIENNLSRNIAIEELAEKVHYHPNYFIRFFKNKMGKSPINYINTLRIKKAESLLFYKDMSISQIAGMVGFNDIHHFSKAFKNHTGFSPTEYRKLK